MLFRSRHPRTEVFSLESWLRWQRFDVGSPPSSLQELAFFLSKVGTPVIPQLLAYIGFRILSQNPQNGAVRTHAQKLGFLNPLGWISIRSSAFLQFLQWSSREMVARSTEKIRSEADPLGRMGFCLFLYFRAPVLILYLVFPLS